MCEHITYNWPSNIVFRPWVGGNYPQGKGNKHKKLLIVGESQYDRSGEKTAATTPESTITMIDEVCQKQWTKRFFTFIATLVEGKRKSGIDVSELWQSIAFYNFIQDYAGTGPRQPPTQAMITDARAIFPTVLELLQPDCVIVLSKRGWNGWIGKGSYPTVPLNVSGKPYPCHQFPAGRAGGCLVTYTHHPTGRGVGGGEKWHHIAEALLNY